MLDHDARSYEMIARVFDGKTEGLTRDDVLDNVTRFTWLTGTAISSARLYWEYKGGFFDVRNVTIPVAVSAFPGRGSYHCPADLRRILKLPSESSSITTSSTKAATLPPGNSRNCSAKNSAGRSSRSANDLKIQTHNHPEENIYEDIDGPDIA